MAEAKRWAESGGPLRFPLSLLQAVAAMQAHATNVAVQEEGCRALLMLAVCADAGVKAASESCIEVARAPSFTPAGGCSPQPLRRPPQPCGLLPA